MKTLNELGICATPWKIHSWTFLKDCVVNGYMVSPIEKHCVNPGSKANIASGRLMSAAPELYEALVALVSCAQKEGPFTQESGMSIAIDAALKAIKKASETK